MVRTVVFSLLAIALSLGTPAWAQETGSGGSAGSAGSGDPSGTGGTNSGTGGTDTTDGSGTAGSGSATNSGGTDAGGTASGGSAGGSTGAGSTSTAGDAGAGASVGSAAGGATSPGAGPAAGGTINSGAAAADTAGSPAPATSSVGASPSPAAPSPSNVGTASIGTGTSGAQGTGVSSARSGVSTSVPANPDFPETSSAAVSARDQNSGPGEPSWLLPASLAPVASRARNVQGSILDALQAQEPLLARPGTSLAIVSACRNSLIEASRPYGVVRVDAASAGRPRTGRKGAIVAPIEARIAYARSDRMQVRQSRIICHLSASGEVMAIR